MLADNLTLEVIPERPIFRNDHVSDIDIAIDIATKTVIGAESKHHAINLCIVLDRSGSMTGDKLNQAKNGCVAIYENLNSNDRFTVLAFDDEVVTVTNPQTPPNLIKERIMSLESGGSTNLSKGWYLGILELQTYATDKHINRLVLLSDGQATVGETKSSILGSESARARNEMGITTSTIGIGSDFEEEILSTLANESGGRFWFIEETKIEDIIKEEFSGALSVRLERPRVEVTLPEGVSLQRELNNLQKTANRYRTRPIKANDQFCFALQLRINPEKITSPDVTIKVSLYDNTDLIQEAFTILKLGSLEEYVNSAEDPRVAIAKAKYFASTSGEQINQEKDSSHITTRLEMLKTHNDFMKNLEEKLAGSTSMSWESMAEAEKSKAEEWMDFELTNLRSEIQESESLVCVDELIKLLNALGKQHLTTSLFNISSKYHYQRTSRYYCNDYHSIMDEQSVHGLLISALDVIAHAMEEIPDYHEELTGIHGRIHEQLEKLAN
ncbi:hypothetical protein GCM10027277_34540 [Pseudoduganella ginsengisoli]|nr:VWA domain-containing protein [Pseudoduganella ginsengisoli]